MSRRARSELIERVSNVLSGRACEAGHGRVASYEELRRHGTPALDPAAWSEHRGRTELRTATLLWVKGRSLTTEDEVLVPASAVFLRHRAPTGCATMLRAGSAGVAAHTAVEAAVDHAVLEVLERDLIWRSWYTDTPPAVVVPPPAAPAEVQSLLGGLGLEATYLVLAGPGNTACTVACLSVESRRQQSFGARCSTGSGASSATAAMYEALMVRWSMQTPEAERAWRGRRPRDALEHALWTFHAQDSLGLWLDRGAGQATPGRLNAVDDNASLAEVVAAHTGEDVVAVDTTAPEVTPEGITVVRVVAPGARRLPADESEAHPTAPHPIG